MRESTPRSSALTRLCRTIERAAAILFARSDARARAAGWDVTATGRCRTSRVYHDPRYDRLAGCPRCAGTGCPSCAGTGRITRPQAAAPDPARPRRPPAAPDPTDWHRAARDGAAGESAACGRTARDCAGWVVHDPGGRHRAGRPAAGWDRVGWVEPGRVRSRR
jgi:hypothetical protein